MYNRRSGFLMCLAAPFFAFLVQQGLSIMWMEIYMGYSLSHYDGGDYMEYMQKMSEGMMNADALAIVSMIYAIICIVWFGVWYYRLKYNMPHDTVTGPAIVKDKAYEVMDKQRGLFEGYSWTIIPGLILLALGGQVVCSFFMEFVGSLRPSWYEFYEELMKSMGMESDKLGVPIILYALILGPVCEELTFRGLSYNYARRSLGFWATNIITALLFGLMHMNPLQGSMAALIGLVFGALYEKSRNIFVPMALHILFNTAGLLGGQFVTLGDTPFKFFAILLVSLLVSYVGYELVIRAIPQRIDIEIR
ncbi:MAG: CPBP family intramembrane metalloprotease [Lachnospiraceae bacterium]|nr:CPBP family intramembrane metalloprotease [Lachnospiraceae bacterium]